MNIHVCRWVIMVGFVQAYQIFSRGGGGWGVQHIMKQNGPSWIGDFVKNQVSKRSKNNEKGINWIENKHDNGFTRCFKIIKSNFVVDFVEKLNQHYLQLQLELYVIETHQYLHRKRGYQ